MRVKPVVTLTPETAALILQLRGRLSFLWHRKDTWTNWTGHVRSSPTRCRTLMGRSWSRLFWQRGEWGPLSRESAKLGHRPRALGEKARLRCPKTRRGGPSRRCWSRRPRTRSHPMAKIAVLGLDQHRGGEKSAASEAIRTLPPNTTSVTRTSSLPVSSPPPLLDLARHRRDVHRRVRCP